MMMCIAGVFEFSSGKNFRFWKYKGIHKAYCAVEKAKVVVFHTREKPPPIEDVKWQ